MNDTFRTSSITKANFLNKQSDYSPNHNLHRLLLVTYIFVFKKANEFQPTYTRHFPPVRMRIGSYICISPPQTYGYCESSGAIACFCTHTIKDFSHNRPCT